MRIAHDAGDDANGNVDDGDGDDDAHDGTDGKNEDGKQKKRQLVCPSERTSIQRKNKKDKQG